MLKNSRDILPTLHEQYKGLKAGNKAVIAMYCSRDGIGVMVEWSSL